MEQTFLIDLQVLFDPLYGILASVAALPPPGFETLSMVDLLRYQADHLDFCCVSTTVYLDLVLLCICCRVSATVFAVLYICHCFCRCISTAVYPPLCICPCECAAVDLLLFICRCVSATVSTVLYIRHCICYCISTTVSAVLYIYCCICRCISTAVYLPLCLLYY